jgi:hypothetical protein
VKGTKASKGEGRKTRTIPTTRGIPWGLYRHTGSHRYVVQPISSTGNDLPPHETGYGLLGGGVGAGSTGAVVDAGFAAGTLVDAGFVAGVLADAGFVAGALVDVAAGVPIADAGSAV